MANLERARILRVKEGKSGSDDQDFDKDNPIEVCFNPKEYSLDKSVGWDSESAVTDAPKPEFTRPSPMTLSVTLQFDTYEEGVSVRNKYVRRIEELAMMRKDTSSASFGPEELKDAGPPTIIFQWGKFIFRGVIESLSQRYTMFLSDGTPVRAECSLKIRNVHSGAFDDPNAQLWQQGNASAGTRTYVVKEGDRIFNIAQKELGDAYRYLDICALSDITDPLEIEVGTVLTIPEA